MDETKHFPVVFALSLQVRTKADRKLANMKLIAFVFFSVLIGTLVGAVPGEPVSFCLNYFTTTVLNYFSNNVREATVIRMYINIPE